MVHSKSVLVRVGEGLKIAAAGERLLLRLERVNGAATFMVVDASEDLVLKVTPRIKRGKARPKRQRGNSLPFYRPTAH